MSHKKFLRTVLGDVALEKIGQVLPHEHLLCDFSPVTHDRNHVFNNPEFAIRELEEMKQDVSFAPGKAPAIVEMTLPDLGRDPAGLLRIARSTGIHIVMGTGWYLEPYYPQDVYDHLSLDLADRMITEIRDGYRLPNGEVVRAGVIGEIGTHGGEVSPAEERVLRAAAKASLETGAAVSTHAFLYPTGVPQARILLDEGMDPEKIIIGHADTFLDQQYHRELLEMGVNVQFDTCGREHLFSDNMRVEFLLRMLDDGWVNQLLISSDRCHKSDLKLFGGLGYSWTLHGFTSLMQESGIGTDIVQHITSTNPQRVLSGISV